VGSIGWEIRLLALPTAVDHPDVLDGDPERIQMGSISGPKVPFTSGLCRDEKRQSPLVLSPTGFPRI